MPCVKDLSTLSPCHLQELAQMNHHAWGFRPSIQEKRALTSHLCCISLWHRVWLINSDERLATHLTSPSTILHLTGISLVSWNTGSECQNLLIHLTCKMKTEQETRKQTSLIYIVILKLTPTTTRKVVECLRNIPVWDIPQENRLIGTADSIMAKGFRTLIKAAVCKQFLQMIALIFRCISRAWIEGWICWKWSIFLLNCET